MPRLGRQFARSPSPCLPEQPAQFSDGTRVKTMYDTQCQNNFKKIIKGTLATIVSSCWNTDSREYKIASVQGGAEYYGVPEDAITDKLEEEDLNAFG